MERLYKLKELLDAGILTQEEFDEQKRKIMDQVTEVSAEEPVVEIVEEVSEVAEDKSENLVELITEPVTSGGVSSVGEIPAVEEVPAMEEIPTAIPVEGPDDGFIEMDVPLGESTNENMSSAAMPKPKKKLGKKGIIGIIAAAIVIIAIFGMSGGSHTNVIQGDWHWVAYTDNGDVETVIPALQSWVTLEISGDSYTLDLQGTSYDGDIEFVEKEDDDGETYYYYKFDGYQVMYAEDDDQILFVAGGESYLFERD